MTPTFFTLEQGYAQGYPPGLWIVGMQETPRQKGKKHARPGRVPNRTMQRLYAVRPRGGMRFQCDFNAP